jgi:hypothetical protein
MILLNGEEQTTAGYDQSARPTLIAKESGKKVRPGDKLQVRNPTGSISPELSFAGQ